MLAALLLTACCFAPMGMKGQEKATTVTYRLQAVTSITSGEKYVFYRNSRVLTTISNKVVNTISSYKTTDLTGSENYVWQATSRTSGSNSGFVLKNVSVGSYMCNTSSTDMTTNTSISSASIWSITFTNGVALISNLSNGSRFLGDNGSNQYKAYAASNLSLYSHDITVYQLVEEINYTITALSNNSSYGTVSLSGKIITATPNSGYRVSTMTPYSVSPSGSATVAQSGNQFTVTPSANTTVTINFEAIPTYTVTLGDNNTTLTEVSAGAGVTLPTRSDVSPYTFAGWSTTNNQTETTTAPAIINAGTYHPTSNITLYPVYTRTEGQDVTQWQKVSFPSSGSSLSGTYALLTPDGHAFKGTFSGGDGQVTSTAFAFNSNNVATSVPSDVCELTFEAVSGGFKIKNANSSSSQYFYASKASSGNLGWHATEDSYWRSTGSNLLYNKNSAYLRAYNNSSFRSYSSTSGTAITFAKKVTATVSTTYYISVVEQPVLEPSCEITPDIYEFGNVAIGSTNTATFTVNTENLEGNLTVSIDHTADGFSVSPASIASTATTTTLTVTFAPSAATADLTVTLTISGGGLEDDVEALISGKAVQAYTVTFNCNGGMATAPAQQSVLSGGSVTFPTAANLNDEFTFVGWTIDPEYVDDDDIFHVGESAAVNSDETYYAVYSHTNFVPDGTASFVKVTENLSDWSGEYLIVYEDRTGVLDSYAFNGSLTTLDVANNGVEVAINGNTIACSETLDGVTFTIASRSGENAGYSIKSKSGYYIGHTGSSNELKTSTTDDYANGITYQDGIDINCGTYYLRYNDGSNNGNRFRYYSSSTSQQAIHLYKYTEGGTTTTARYTRVFLNETATDDIEIDGPSIIPSDYSLDMGENSLDNATAANLVIEEGGQLIHSNNGVQATLQKDITAYTSQKDNYYLIALPFDSYSVGGSPFVAVSGNYDLYTFDGSQTQEEWQQVGTDGAFEPAVGFLYANNVGGTLNLTGTLVPSNEPYNAYLEYDATKTYGAWNLVGNPFACNATISVSDFYVIDGEELTATTGVIAPLQGVMVQATEPSQQITFTKATGAKSAQAIKVNVYKENASKGAAVVDRAIVRFDESQGLVKFQLNPSHTKVYFTQDNKDYAVVHSGSEAEMPVSFKAEKSGSYTFNVETENVEMNYLHLIDNMTGTDVDLLATPSYTFEANTRDYANRFKLVFKANTGVEENAATETFAYFNGSEWVINNPSTGSGDNATLQVIDMMGRVLSSETISGNANVNINQAAGIYMLRLVNGENVKVQKVVVR